MPNQSPVVHFEIPGSDRKRMAKFYADTFGWKTMMGEEMGNYVLVQTTETDDNGMVQKAGTINGGLYEKTNENQNHVTSIIIKC